MYATIEPVPVFPSTATVLSINNVNVQPGTSAAFQWWLQSTERGNLTAGTINLEGAAYAAWGADDEYLYRYAAEALGLTITEIVPDAVATSPVASPAPVEAPVAPPVVEEPAFTIPEVPLDVLPAHVEEPGVATVEALVSPPVVEEPAPAPTVVKEPEPTAEALLGEATGDAVSPLEADPAAGSI